MTRNEVVQKMESKAKELGIRIVDDPKLGCWVDYDHNYAMVSVVERVRHRKADIARQIKAGYFKVTAGICSGEMNADQFFAAADQTYRAAAFVKFCSEMDLSYREDADGNPV